MANRSVTKDRFAAGVAVLTVSNLLTKAMGLIFRIPMNRLMGDTAMGYYNAAYSIFTFFYMLSTAGIPVALSILVARARTESDQTQIRRIFHTALWLLMTIGIAGSAILLFFSSSLAKSIGAPPAAWCIVIISPTLFFICIASALRGYFQGLSCMGPTAVSQLLETGGKVIIGLLCGGYALHCGFSSAIVAAYAVVGLTLGTALGMLYLVIVKCLHNPVIAVSDFQPQSYQEILREFARIAIPVTVSSSVMSLTNMIDTAMIQRLLQAAGMTQEAATAAFGNYTSLAVPLFNLPPVLIYPIAYAVVPRITGYKVAGQVQNLQDCVIASIKITAWIGMPCALGLSVMAKPILLLLYRPESATVAAPLLTLLAPSSLLVCMLAITNSVLQAYEKAKMPVYAMLAGAAMKMIASILLIPRYGIVASPIGTFLCYAVVCIINLYNTVAVTGCKLSTGIFLRPAIASGIAVAGAYTVYTVCEQYVVQSWFTYGLALTFSILFAIVVYIPILWLTGAVEHTDIAFLPFPQKIKKYLYEVSSPHFVERKEENAKRVVHGTKTRSCRKGILYFGRLAYSGRDSTCSRRMSVGQRTDPYVHSK